MDSKKISFGFSKQPKKPNVLPTKPLQQKKDVEFIECIEEQSIKVKDAKQEESNGALVIPLSEPSSQIIHKIKESRAKQNRVKNEVDERPDSELTLDELAARELLKEARNAGVKETATRVLEVPNIANSNAVEEKAEPDYDSVSVNDLGWAMFRGMGWKDGMALGKNPNAKIEKKEYDSRPRGLGLGANKMANVAKQSAKNNDEEDLVLKKGAYAKLTAGHHKGSYCQIEAVDGDTERVFVKLAVGGSTLSINQALLTLVTKQEYEKSSKVINNAKYEEYIKAEASGSGNRGRDEQDASGRIKREVEEDRSSSRRSKSRERGRKKHKKSSKKHKKRRSSSFTDDDEEEERKSRRSKKDRSRSRERSRKHSTKHKR